LTLKFRKFDGERERKKEKEWERENVCVWETKRERENKKERRVYVFNATTPAYVNERDRVS
jgi:hypothetical protein